MEYHTSPDSVAAQYPPSVQDVDIPIQKERTSSVEDEPSFKKLRTEVQSTAKSHQGYSNLREWSTLVEKAISLHDEQTCTLYQCKAYFGDPEHPLPHNIRSARKELIGKMLQEKGFSSAECIGTKSQLLEKLQKDKPYVRFRIDGREGFQRVLATALSAFKYDLSHMYSVKLPFRGINVVGTKTFKEMFRDFYEHGLSQHADRDYYRFMLLNIAHDEFPDLARDQRELLVQNILDGKIPGEAHRPTRVLRGFAFEMPGEFTRHVEKVNDHTALHSIDLDLNYASLHVGDKMKFIYDFGDPHIITVYIERILHDHAVLNEISLDYLPVRAQVIEQSEHKPPPQYGGAEDEGTEEEEEKPAEEKVHP